MGKYLLNKETQKVELHFTKSEYLALSEELKKEIKSNFLFSKYSSAWVSRSIHYHGAAERIAQKLGLENAGAVGERLSYAEELEHKAERAEARAERYEEYSDNAEKRAKQLQSALDSHRGDIAFFTQPIISGHSGSQAFANYRNRLYARYDRGFEEYKKSAYYQDRAVTARATADNAKLKDKVYLHNRIKECNSNIKKLQESIVAAENNIYKMQQGEVLKHWDGSLATIEGQEKRIESTLEKYDYEQGKLEFFENCISELGGIEFSQDNIKVGYIVKIARWGKCEVVSTGKVNISYKILEGGAHGGVLTDPYAAIKEIIAVKEAPKVKNPYQVNDILCHYNISGNRVINAYQVMKITDTGVKLQQIKVENNIPLLNNFISDKQMQKKVVKSKWSDTTAVYQDDWQLYKYNTESKTV